MTDEEKKIVLEFAKILWPKISFETDPKDRKLTQKEWHHRLAVTLQRLIQEAHQP